MAKTIKLLTPITITPIGEIPAHYSTSRRFKYKIKGFKGIYTLTGYDKKSNKYKFKQVM